MDSISTARDFFINQQGLSPDQADMIVSKGMEAYNQQSQPQNMMQMASGGIARLGYQMGGSPMGIQSMPMDTGQSLQVPQQMPTNFSSAQSITSNPLLNYGQTPLSMNRGGIARLGYQDGGEAMMQPQMGGEEEMIQMDQQQALQTIIDILIQNGIPPEQAQQLAQQILQIFIQGGAPAVEAFANQLEQQEQAQAMASGGIAGYGYRQGYGFGGIGKIFSGAAKAVSGAVKGVANAVKSVAKSPIGKIALTIAATYALGPAGLGIGQMASATPWIASAINAGLANTLVQGLTTGKFNPTQALTAAALGGFSGAMGVPGTAETTATNITADGTNLANAYNAQGIGNTTLDTTGFGTDYGSTAGLRTAPTVNDITGARSDAFSLDRATLDPAAGKGSQIYNPGVETKPGILQNLQTKMSDALSNPIQTLRNIGTGAIDLIEQYPKTATAIGTGIGFGTGYAIGSPQGKDESDEDFAKRQQEEVNPLITYYGRNLQIKNPYFYQKFGATNPFETAAQGGIMGYKRGGSMVPPARQIEGGVIELDARKSGGYIPYGKKERHDDVPAMLAKDEFVFTSKAVKAAGGGDAKRGAAKMYALMKQLEGARS